MYQTEAAPDLNHVISISDMFGSKITRRLIVLIGMWEPY